jgi:signal transduction histidine kinase
MSPTSDSASPPRLVVVGADDGTGLLPDGIDIADAVDTTGSVSATDDTVTVESVATVERALSLDPPVDCFILLPMDADDAGATDGDRDPTPSALATLVDTGVSVVVFAPSATLDAATAFEAGAADHVDSDRPDATLVLRRRVEALLRHRRSEQSRRESRRLLDVVFDHAPVHLYVKDRDGRHLRVTDAYLADRSAYLGATDTELYPDADSDSTYRDDMRVVETGKPILDKLEPVLDPSAEQFSRANLHEKYEGVLNQEALEDEPGAIEWVLTSKVPWTEDGEVVGLVGVGIDMTERERAKHRLERQNDRLEEFASIVSHDLRNPLSVAQGNLQLYRRTDDASRLDAVEAAHARMERLVENLLRLARLGQVVDDPEPIPLERLVDDAWATVDTGTATLVYDAGDADDTATTGLGTLVGDPDRLRQLFENLFRNSVEHGSTTHRSHARGDSVEHGSTNSRRDADDAGEHGSTPGSADDGAVEVRVGRRSDGGFYVADDGPGIPPEDRDRVLERGYTTRAEGTGLGLGIVETIAEAHGWTVEVGRSDRGGARFDFVPRRTA